MLNPHRCLPAWLLSLMLWAAGSHLALGQTHQHTPAATPAAPSSSAATPDARPWVEAEVRRIDLAGQRITLRHGPIPNLDMPPMTMVFAVRDPAMLGQIQVGQRIRFSADQIKQQYTVIDWQPIK